MKKLFSVFTAMVMAGWLVGCAAEEAPAPTPAPAPATGGPSMTSAGDAPAGETATDGAATAPEGSGSTTETP
jgi:hypothetical protein